MSSRYLQVAPAPSSPEQSQLPVSWLYTTDPLWCSACRNLYEKYLRKYLMSRLGEAVGAEYVGVLLLGQPVGGDGVGLSDAGN